MYQQLKQYNLETVSKRFFDIADNRKSESLKHSANLPYFSIILDFFFISMLKEVADNPDKWWVVQQFGYDAVPVTIDIPKQQEECRIRSDEKIWIEESKEQFVEQYSDSDKDKELANEDYNLNELIRTVVLKRSVGRLYIKYVTMTLAGSVKRKINRRTYTEIFQQIEQSQPTQLHYSYFSHLITSAIPLLTRRCRRRLHTAVYRHYLRPTPAKKEQLWGLFHRYFGLSIYLEADRPYRSGIRHKMTVPDLSTVITIGRKDKYKTYLDSTYKYQRRFKVSLL